ncbi:FYVE-domain-containing protein [Durotheca rogersii]|uniref:FYVE-domain-containing protein n=1 Tax=Durotheca rogersii TaxID=419775 RepID=UPI00221E4680|nr:FYVE-domain-containing protein [Durotheca rogersii]KAI5867091.1 FYVE-domain-containing protein [Durotheca rogersii]
MSSTSRGGIAPPFSGGNNLAEGDSEPRGLYPGNGASVGPACPYQDAEFFGAECSRYYDCPTHSLRRNTAGESSAESAQNNVGGPAVSHAAALLQPPGTVGGPSTVLTRLVTPTSGQAQGILGGYPSQFGASPLAGHVGFTSPSSSSLALLNSGPGPLAQETGAAAGQALPRAPATPSTTLAGAEGSSSSNIDARPLQIVGSGQIATSSPLSAPPPTSSLGELNPIAPLFSPLSERRPTQEIALPRWQPDSEATYCPICHAQFNFFIRKHHCRKCGRVVCSQCSPHRITIPHQYIVRQPSDRAFQRYSFLGDEGGISDFSIIGGGEQVRLCNPCVPDPNTAPPQAQHPANQLPPISSHQRSQSTSSGNAAGDGSLNRYPQFLTAPNLPDAYARSRSVTMNASASPSRLQSGTYVPTHNRILAGTPPAYYPQSYSGYRHPSFMDHRFLAPPIDYGGPSTSSSSSVASSSAAVMNRPLPPPPPIPEEDECPVCHRELPSRDLPNFETLRESHISSCVTAHSTYSAGSDSGGRSGNYGTASPQMTRLTGQFPYLATEKDCVDSAECTICLEEFEVGVRMARLECLCRFHKDCIDAWFCNHPGRCPVHQHDSYGY